jgi:hypothetical protein
VAKRRKGSAPIQAFVGLNGSGKTLGAMALAVLPVLDRGGSALTTCHIMGQARARPLTRWRELVWMERERRERRDRGEELEPMVVFLDEVTSSLPARQAMSLPPQLARLFNQLRKVNVQLVWTAPNWARADKLLREVTSTVTVCRGVWPDRWQRGDDGKSKLKVDGKALRAPGDWPPNRLFRFATYSAEDYEEFTLSRAAKLRPVGRTWYRRKAHDAHLRYDTYDAVELLDHVDDAGLCVACGLPRPRGKCTCTADERAAAEAPPGAQPLLASVNGQEHRPLDHDHDQEDEQEYLRWSAAYLGRKPAQEAETVAAWDTWQEIGPPERAGVGFWQVAQ